MTNEPNTPKTPKPVFPPGVEPEGLRRGVDYDWYSKDVEPPVAARHRRPHDNMSEWCFYCGDEIDDEGLGIESGDDYCDYSPTGLHELDEVEEDDERLWDGDQYIGGHHETHTVSHGLGYPTTDRRAPLKNHQDALWTTSQAERQQADYVPGNGGYWWKGTWHEYTAPAASTTATSTWLPDRHSTTYQPYKPAPSSWRNWPWTEWRSHDAANSDNLFVRIYGRYRDAQQNYASCALRRHWGPRGGAGLVPWTMAPDGKVYVLLSHRSYAVENGGTWSSFGGALDKGETPFQAAVREAFEEVEGLPAKGIITTEVARPCHVCGWLYTTFLVQVKPAYVKVNRKSGSGWETTEVRWVPASAVSTYNLHPGFAKTWPELYTAIRAAVSAAKARKGGSKPSA